MIFNQDAYGATGKPLCRCFAYFARLAWPIAVFSSLWVLTSGCAGIISRYSAASMEKMAGNLSRTFLNYDDLATVEAAAPAYLLVMDSLLADTPDNEPLLLGAAKLYTSYTAAFVTDESRSRRLSEKGFQYALRALCNRHAAICEAQKMPFDAFTESLSGMTMQDLAALYGLGTAWTTYLEARSSDWHVIAQLPRIEAIMARVVQLDETYEDGGAHLYLAVFATLVPPALGGRPETARLHFEQALKISGKKNLMAYVLYARHYAKMMFDRELYDRLLKAALAADPRVTGYVLVNMAAQREARQMLAEADSYF